MRRTVFTLPVIALVGITMLVVSYAIAEAAIKITRPAAARAEGEIRACGNRFQGKTPELNRCISDALTKLSRKLRTPNVPTVAPKAAPVVANAARQVRRQRRKRPAVRVMNKARSVLRALAAKSSGETRQVYDRVSRVFAVAASVISSKGGA